MNAIKQFKKYQKGKPIIVESNTTYVAPKQHIIIPKGVDIEEYIKQYNRAYNKRLIEERRKNQQYRRIASGASVIGNTLAMFPSPYTYGAGILLQIPDIIYDIQDFKDNPNAVNAIHLGLDFLGTGTGAINDFFKSPGIVDDGANAILGTDIPNNLIQQFTPEKVVPDTTYNVHGVPIKYYKKTKGD